MEVELIFDTPPEMGEYHSKKPLRLNGEVKDVFCERDGSLSEGGAEIIFYKWVTPTNLKEYKEWVLSTLKSLYAVHKFWTDDTCGLHVSFRDEDLSASSLVALEIAYFKYALPEMKRRYFRKYARSVLEYNGRYTLFADRDENRIEWRAPNLGDASSLNSIVKRLEIMFKILNEGFKLEKKLKPSFKRMKKNLQRVQWFFASSSKEMEWDYNYGNLLITRRYKINSKLFYYLRDDLYVEPRKLRNAMGKNYSYGTEKGEMYYYYVMFSSLKFLRRIKKRVYDYWLSYVEREYIKYGFKLLGL